MKKKTSVANSKLRVPEQAPTNSKFDRRTFLIEIRAVVALLIIVVFFSLMTDRYLQVDNILLMTRHVAMNAILAIGMLLVILNGGIDLSVGSIVGLSGVVAGYLLQGAPIPGTDLVAFPNIWAVLLISLGVGIVFGYLNGFLIARLNIAPFIATLGMLYVARGLAKLITNGTTFTKLAGTEELGNTGFIKVFASQPLGIPLPIWIMFIFAAIFSVILNRTAFGRWLYASGGNNRAAALSGVPVKRVNIRIYVLSGFCAAMVGVLFTADLRASIPNMGEFSELNAIAAVVIGGTALSGGRGTIRGTLIGAFVIGFLVDGLVLIGISVFWQETIKGAVIIVAVAVEEIQKIVERRRKLRIAT